MISTLKESKFGLFSVTYLFIPCSRSFPPSEKSMETSSMNTVYGCAVVIYSVPCMITIHPSNLVQNMYDHFFCVAKVFLFREQGGNAGKLR